MIKIVTIDEQEILLDYREASDVINTACERDDLKVTGCCKHNNHIVVNLEPQTGEERQTYIIAPLAAASDAELIATIRSRYDAGFTTITKFEIESQYWGLFSSQV